MIYVYKPWNSLTYIRIIIIGIKDKGFDILLIYIKNRYSPSCIKEAMINTKMLKINIYAVCFGNPLHSRILSPPLEIMVFI
jgi:hypothetical protein